MAQLVHVRSAHQHKQLHVSRPLSFKFGSANDSDTPNPVSSYNPPRLIRSTLIAAALITAAVVAAVHAYTFVQWGSLIYVFLDQIEERVAGHFPDPLPPREPYLGPTYPGTLDLPDRRRIDPRWGNGLDNLAFYELWVWDSRTSAELNAIATREMATRTGDALTSPYGQTPYRIALLSGLVLGPSLFLIMAGMIR